MKIICKNGHIMVKEMIRTEEESKTAMGLIIPKETLDDDEVAQGQIIFSQEVEYPVNSIIIFHKTLPVNAMLKLDGDEQPKEYFFVNSRDVVCIVEK